MKWACCLINNMKILGIDPGNSRVGWGLIQKEHGNVVFVSCGTLETRAKNQFDKILEISGRFADLLKELEPELIGIERLFFSKNKKTALAVAEARGVLISQALALKIPIYECLPSEAKQAVTGYGLSDKKAVAGMVIRILNIKIKPEHDDATDALAIAIAAAYLYPKL